MSSNEHATGHEWGFVEGMASQNATPGALEEPAEPTSTDAPEGPGARRERVTAFVVDDTVLFVGQFTDADVLGALAPYYNHHRRRFEVPADAFEAVERTLADAGYDVVVVTDVSRHAVVVDAGTPHPEAVVVDSVFDVSVDDRNVFVLASDRAVTEAVAGGATPLTDTPLRLSLSASADVGPVTVRHVSADGLE